MATTPALRRVLLAQVAVVVCLVGAAAAWVFGFLACVLYGLEAEVTGYGAGANLMPVSLWWGPATGLIAGIVWCGVMFPRVTRHPQAQVVRVGAWVGLGVGALSAALLHGGLMLVAGGWFTWGMLAGLGFGMPVGLIAGAVCGAGLRAVVGAAMRYTPADIAKDTA